MRSNEAIPQARPVERDNVSARIHLPRHRVTKVQGFLQRRGVECRLPELPAIGRRDLEQARGALRSGAKLSCALAFLRFAQRKLISRRSIADWLMRY
jgi:hypothetical protein